MSIYKTDYWITVDCAYLQSLANFSAFKWQFKEALSRPYEGILSFCTSKPLSQDSMDKLINCSIKVTWRNTFAQQRFINGRITEVHAYQDKNLANYYCYRFVVKSWFSTLQMSRDYKVYINQTMYDIVSDVLRPHNIAGVDYKSLSQSYAPRPYTVRYNDTADNFLNRLFYEFGVYYSFRHDNNNTYLVLHDGFGHTRVEDKMKVYPEKTQPTDLIGVGIWNWRSEVTGKPDAVSTLIYDRSQNKTYQDKKPNINYAKRGQPTEWFTYPATPNVAKQKVAQDFFETEKATFHTNDLTMIPGARFDVTKHFHEEYIGKHWVNSVETIVTDYRQIDDNEPEPSLDLTVQAVPDNLGYYPAPKFTNVKARGVDSATVVGPDGKEVYSDEQARVKVKFEWDTHSESFSNTSCWVPVKYALAGYDHGMMFVPRIGQEVVVSYEDGNPEKPIIIGTLANAKNMPPFKPEETPYRSGYKSHTPGDITFANGNTLMFDDDPNTAGVSLQAQKDLELVSEGDKQTTIGDQLTHTIKGGNYSQTTDGTLKVTSDSQIQLAVGMSQILINQSGITIESPKINIDKSVVAAPAPKPSASEQEGLQQLMATLATPDNSNSQTDLPDEQVTPIPQEPIVDAVYSTGQKTFYFLTKKEQELIQKESQPFHDAMVNLYNAEQAVLKTAATSAEKAALLEARQAIDKLLLGKVKGEKLQEIIKIGKGTWGYLPDSVLDQVGATTSVQNQDGYIMYTPKHKQWGKAKQKEVLIKKKQGEPKVVKGKSSQVNIIDAMQTCEAMIDSDGNLFNFDKDLYDGNLTSFAKKIEDGITTQKDTEIKNLGWVDIKADSSARVLRYTAKAGVHGNYDPQTHMLMVSAGGEAKFDLFSAKGHTKLNFPGDDKGYHAIMHLTETNDGIIDLGFFKCEANIKVYEDSGASILAYGNVTASGNTAYQATVGKVKKVKDTAHSGNLLKGQLTDPQGVSINAEAFVGIEAGCYIDGKFYWKSPETVQPIQNPNKASEKLGGIDGTGQPSWVELADLGAGVAADLGIGGALDFSVQYENGKFILVCHAKVVFGDGASGKMQIVIDVPHMEQFIQFVYHQLKNQNFNNLIYENLMDPTTAGAFNLVLIAWLWEIKEIGDLVGDSKTELKRFWASIKEQLQEISNVLKLANNILEDKNNTVRYLPPESKGRILYQLSEYFSDFTSIDTAPAQAMIKLLNHVQSADEWLRTFANVEAIDPDVMNSGILVDISPEELLQKAKQGQQIIFEKLGFFEAKKIMDIEKKLIQSDKVYAAYLQNIAYHYPINTQNYLATDAPLVIANICIIDNHIRGVALQNQAISAFELEDQQLQQLYKDAKKQTSSIDIWDELQASYFERLMN